MSSIFPLKYSGSLFHQGPPIFNIDALLLHGKFLLKSPLDVNDKDPTALFSSVLTAHLSEYDKLDYGTMKRSDAW
jgi:hypothetical protein